MNYLLSVSDNLNSHLVVFTFDKYVASLPAIDVVFSVIGTDEPDELVRANILPAGQVEELKALQNIIFDRDGQGLFIRDTIHFKANGKEIDPEASMNGAFAPSQREGMNYMRCDLTVIDSSVDKAGVTASPGNLVSGNSVIVNQEKSISDQIKDLSRVMFLHQIGIGFAIDVTKDHAKLIDTTAWAEREALIEIDVEKAAYKLTEKGRRIHDSYIAEAQDLIKRFDIYSDVDIDASGIAHFDTELGKDLRVPAFELEGIDPFRARFLLGLNDGEWDQLANWYEVFTNRSWYDEVFKPVENAPSIDEIGSEQMEKIMEQAKVVLRQEQQSRGH